MLVVLTNVASGKPAFFTNIDFFSSFFVWHLAFDSMDFILMRFQTASLCEGFLTILTFIRFHPSVSSNMSLQIERIVESLVAICTFVFFVWRVISTMTIEHSDVLETLATDFTFKLGTMTVTGTLDCSRSA